MNINNEDIVADTAKQNENNIANTIKNVDKDNDNLNTNTKKELTPYQKFLLCKNARYEKYKQKYFDFYDDVKDKTHRIYDW